MPSTFIKATKVVNTALGLLEREIVLPGLVWRDAAGDFAGAYNDTISIRLPAYTTARTRTLRAGTGVTTDDLAETKVDVTLDTDVYKAIKITDEQLTLDISNFGDQVITPCVHAVARGVEDALVAKMNAAPYANTIGASLTDPWPNIVKARKYLNLANVPMGDRFLVVGANFEEVLLNSDRFVKADQAGSDNALRNAIIGKMAGLQVVVSNGLDPDWAIMAHKTAFVLSMRAPVVPDGVTWGSSASFAGMALRTLRDYDFANVSDRFLTDVFVGASDTRDRGIIDGDGKFQPSVDGNATPIQVRAVKLVLSGQS